MAKKPEDKCKGNPVTGTPEMSMHIIPSVKVLVSIRRGERGYYLTDFEASVFLRDRYNNAMGVDAAKRESMKAGSMFGWGCPAADYRNYSKDGKLVSTKTKHKETL